MTAEGHAPAIAATKALLAELSLPVEHLEVLADRSNLVLAVEPHAIVARVAMATSASRVGLAWLRREVEVARYLDERAVPTTRPATAIDPGPHERQGFVISFWQRETLRTGTVDPRAAGKRLAEAHAALRDYPRDRLPLWGAWEETRAVAAKARHSTLLTPGERAHLHAAFADAQRVVASAATRSASMQAVHGDAHFGNVMATARGELWTDWEDAFIGPVEWDVASFESRRRLFGEESDAVAAAMDAYASVPGADYNRDLAEELGAARNVQVIAWLTLFAERQPELLDRVRARLDRL